MHKPRVVAIIQARMGSSRLPGKTLADIAGKPLLSHVIERVKASRTIDEVVVATTTDPEDQAILRGATEHGLRAFAGSTDDVLDRFYQVARQTDADVIVRITADDPFKDPQVIDRFVRNFLADPELDFVSEAQDQPTYPEGVGVSVFSFETLAKAWQEARLPSEREHVIPYILNNPDKFNIGSVQHGTDLSHLRWTLDYEEDLRFTREVYKRLSHKGLFSMQDILDLLQAEPELFQINQDVERNAGYRMSLQQDGVFEENIRART